MNTDTHGCKPIIFYFIMIYIRIRACSSSYVAKNTINAAANR